MAHSRTRRTLLLLIPALFSALVLRLYFFYISITHIPVSTDEALEFLIAKAILNGSKPLLFWGTPYQFPIESYLLAPWIPYLPVNATGARLLLALLASLAPFAFIVLIKKIFRSHVHIVYLLILFPSAYIVTLQSAYFIPQYTFTGLIAWLLPLTALPAIRNPRKVFFVALSGLLAGLALSAHLLSLPLVAAISATLCIGHNVKSAIRNSFLFIALLAVGLLPYLTVYPEVKEAANAVHGSYSLAEGILRFFEPAISDNLKVLIGPEYSVFPDLSHIPGLFSFLSMPYIFIFWAVLIYGTSHRLSTLLPVIKNRSWPVLDLEDTMLAATWLALLAFALSTRGESGEYRYLLPVAWCFPFIVATTLTRIRGRLASLLQAAIGLLIGINIFNYIQVISTWQQPAYFSKEQDLPDLSRIIRYLDKKNIHHCFASFWHTNRITFETNEKIICSPPFNDRFAEWPLPFRETVENSSRAAYVLSNSKYSRFPIHAFERMLNYHKLTATTKKLGSFKIYHDFTYQGVAQSIKLAASDFKILTSDTRAAKSIGSIVDADRNTTWKPPKNRSETVYIEFTLPETLRMHRVRLYFTATTRHPDPLYTVELLTNTVWKPIQTDIRPGADLLFMRGSFPIFLSDHRQDITFAPQQVKAIRLAIHPGIKAQWEIAEVELYQATAEEETRD